MPSIATALAFSLALSLAHSPDSDEPASLRAQKIEEVARRGAGVMPFALERTKHVFTKSPLGGQQKVEVKDAKDVQQIALIRKHLSEIAAEFQQGRFLAPAAIHGADMPGLRELSAAAPDELKIRWRQIPLGAKIDFQSQKPELVAALHQWFDAQVSEHGHHAAAGHAHHGK